ncbi:hypothetical protein E6E08_25000 [Escherichia coli]|uniref:Uncharacterized protein n=1 Tax=Salmonella enterica TaxID=28901 RepID=A0A703K631_SALER|nr:hypothetical protein [Escherichia coli]ECE7258705.1 hypothetical protein [Salmonella enterica subsp. enterica]ECG9765544.1 hypothetical protein [Salmonella enterica]ECM3534821.1 hypothetical protein [Salmonella enterica subsp. enterica serovar Typhimurium]ECR2560899.1 hypothetical protein [Salmonella enterica subsp. enterica serovar Stanley]
MVSGFLGRNHHQIIVCIYFNGQFVTAPRPVGRGFPLLRPQPSVRRIYAGLHGRRRRVPPPVVPVFLFAGC